MTAPTKKSNLKIIAISLFATIVFSNCDSPAQKVDAAKENVTEAQTNLNKAQDDYQTEVDNFKKESNEKISDNEKIIADLKSKMNMVKKESKKTYLDQIAALEKENVAIKIRLDAYKYDTKENWGKFKEQFNNDMQNLGNSIKKISVKDNK